MWFLFPPKARKPLARFGPSRIRPRLEVLEDRRLMSAGALDTTFNSPTGEVTTALTGNPAFAPVVVYPNTGTSPATDGKIVTGAQAINASGNYCFALTRYNADGTLDMTFGNNGIASTAIGTLSNGNVKINALALQSDGKIVAGGFAYYPNTGSAALTVARYYADGSLDNSFGSSGIVQTLVPVTSKRNSGGFDDTSAVAVDAMGRIVVGGDVAQSDGQDFALFRYTSAGKLDTTFGKNGITITPNFGGAQLDDAYGLALYPNAGTANDGKILLVGQGNSGTTPGSTYMAVARYTKDGLLDTSSFNAGGTTPGIVWPLSPSGSASSYGRGVVVQSTGTIVVSGVCLVGNTPELTLARLANTGQLDLAFGGAATGFATNSNMSGFSRVAQGPNGDLLVAGRSRQTPTADFAIAAYLPNGTPDTTFGAGGLATADFSGGNDASCGLAVQGDGRIVAAGVTTPAGSNTSNLALARFLPPNTKIGSFTANPNPATAGSSVTLTASNILNSNPTSSIAQVTFSYVDYSGNTVVLLAAQTSPGFWTYTAPTGLGLTAGTYSLSAVATDNNDLLSDPVVISFTVA